MAFRPLKITPSTNVAAVEYDPDTTTLVITYHRNLRRYRYDQVPWDVAAGFENSGLTAGRYFNLFVLGVFGYTEI